MLHEKDISCSLMNFIDFYELCLLFAVHRREEAHQQPPPSSTIFINYASYISFHFIQISFYVNVYYYTLCAMPFELFDNVLRCLYSIYLCFYFMFPVFSLLLLIHFNIFSLFLLAFYIVFMLFLFDLLFFPFSCQIFKLFLIILLCCDVDFMCYSMNRVVFTKHRMLQLACKQSKDTIGHFKVRNGLFLEGQENGQLMKKKHSKWKS